LVIEKIDVSGLVRLADHPLVRDRLRGLPTDRVAQLLGEERMLRLRDGEDVAVFEDRALDRHYGIVCDIDHVNGFTWDVLEYLFLTIGAVELVLDSVRDDAGQRFGAYLGGLQFSQATPARWHWRLERKAFLKANEERQINVEVISETAGTGSDGGSDCRNESASAIADREGPAAAVTAGGGRKQRAPRAEHRQAKVTLNDHDIDIGRSETSTMSD
jgi:hypothetical protein